MKLFRVLQVMLILLFVVGCQTNNQEMKTSTNDATESVTTKENESQNLKANQTESKLVEPIYGKDGLPPLEDELLAFYKEAYDFFEKYHTCGFKYDYNQSIETDRGIYYKVIEPQMDTLEALNTKISSYFTQDTEIEMLENKIFYPDKLEYFIEKDNCLYVLGFDSPSNIFYAGHVFELISKSENKIGLKLIRYLSKDTEPNAGDNELVFTIPEDNDKYDVEEKYFILIKETDGWRFSEMNLIRK